ncbi:MAG: YlmH/Sll1252 family protein [Erysipelotrichaceae bacterium]|uniref:YlmH/Sll1252 family protein n=1 Tax=Floccifex sp. TaxID=2815810 RepID=UPI002A760577|nr:YlmH/Sll1252 family protein [Floccifex sp.]MDD7281808.1 YlmH/Sll1252 family protein [Erysipelotrichaceae bacterium]MDY2958069.1 YlmH/Sll1252 family protein [Floccifex sp.]
MPNSFYNKFKGHELFIASMQDQFDLVHYRAKPIVTSFLTINEQEIVKTICPGNLSVSFFGGYENAIRQVCCISEYDEEFDYDICCLMTRYNSNYNSISHHDVLGALMNLGIDRNQIGDFVIEQDRVYIFCTKNISEFIIMQCNTIARTKVKFDYTENIPLNIQNFKELHINCASNRLDAIVAQLARCSRKEALNKIHHKDVKLNDFELEENCQLCLNDVVSIHRVGKFIYRGVVSTTKKDRYILKFDQFI